MSEAISTCTGVGNGHDRDTVDVMTYPSAGTPSGEVRGTKPNLPHDLADLCANAGTLDRDQIVVVTCGFRGWGACGLRRRGVMQRRAREDWEKEGGECNKMTDAAISLIALRMGIYHVRAPRMPSDISVTPLARFVSGAVLLGHAASCSRAVGSVEQERS